LGENVWKDFYTVLLLEHDIEVVPQFSEAYGMEKSTISEHFIQASPKKLHD
jgi:hypothetical protein